MKRVLPLALTLLAVTPSCSEEPSYEVDCGVAARMANAGLRANDEHMLACLSDEDCTTSTLSIACLAVQVPHNRRTPIEASAKAMWFRDSLKHLCNRCALPESTAPSGADTPKVHCRYFGRRRRFCTLDETLEPPAEESVVPGGGKVSWSCEASGGMMQALVRQALGNGNRCISDDDCIFVDRVACFDPLWEPASRMGWGRVEREVRALAADYCRACPPGEDPPLIVGFPPVMRCIPEEPGVARCRACSSRSAPPAGWKPPDGADYDPACP